MVRNPFKPMSGKLPPELIGREEAISEFEEGLDNGPGSPGSLIRVSGIRGMGKTSLLREFGRLARERGMLVLNDTAGEGMCARLVEQLSFAGHGELSGKIGLNMGVLSAEIGAERSMAVHLRNAVAAYLSHARKGIFFAIDEVQDASMDEMRELASAFQILIGEDCEVYLAFAGLPSMVANVVEGKTLTFLRRATPIELTRLSKHDVADSLRSTFDATGFSIEEDGLRQIVDDAGGYPYLIQLMGYHIWQEAYRRQRESQRRSIEVEDIVRGTERARERFRETVIETALQRCAAGRLSYLRAMAAYDGGEVPVSFVGSRLGKSQAELSKPRRQLIDDGIIESRERGMVSFTIPYLQDYLRKLDR